MSSLNKGLIAHYPLKGLLGEEILNDNTFEDSSNWSTTGWWTFGTNTATFGDGGTGSIYQTVTITEGKRYRCEFFVTSGSNPYIVVANQAGSDVTGKGYQWYSTGKQSIEFTATTSGTQLRFYSTTNGSAFTINYLSFKEVLPNKVDSELVTNSDLVGFTSGVANNWTSANYNGRVTFSEDTDGSETVQKVVGNQDTDDSAWGLYQSITLESGKNYVLSYTIKSNRELQNGTSGDYKSHIDGQTTGLDVTSTSGEKVTRHFYFTSTTTGSTTVCFGCDAPNFYTSHYIYFYDISVKEVQTPDVTPNSNNGVIYGASQNKNSVSFDGTDDMITFDNISVMDGNPNYTLSAWINTTTNGSLGIINIGNYTTNYQANALRTISGNIKNYWWSEDLTTSGQTVNDGNDHLITATFDGTTRSIYIDGELAGYDTPSNTHNVIQDGSNTVGKTYDTEYFDGTLWDARIYNRALTSQEITDLYKLGGNQRTIDTGSLKKGLVLDMPLREKDEKVGSLLNTGTFAKQSGGSGTLTSPTSTGWTSFTSGDTYDRVGVTLSSTLESGKTYRVGWTGLTSSSGSVQCRTYTSANMLDSEGTTLGIYSGGDEEFEFVATGTENRIGFKNLSHPTTIVLTGFYIKELYTADLTPNQHKGEVYGVTQNTNEMSFDGSNDYVDLGSDSSFSPEGKHSVSVWCKLTSGVDRTPFGFRRSSNESSAFMIYFRQGYIRPWLKSDSDTYLVGEEYAYSTNTWYHVVATWNTNGGTNKLYVNGEFQAESGTIDSSDSWTYDSSQSLSVGRYGPIASAFFWSGNIRDVKAWNRVLTSDEIKQLYKREL